jgi:hypothetical protein
MTAVLRSGPPRADTGGMGDVPPGRAGCAPDTTVLFAIGRASGGFGGVPGR